MGVWAMLVKSYSIAQRSNSEAQMVTGHKGWEEKNGWVLRFSKQNSILLREGMANDLRACPYPGNASCGDTNLTSTEGGKTTRSADIPGLL